MSTPRKIVDEKDARACLVAVARSGATLRAWARRHGVDGRSLHAWQMNLSGRSGSNAAAARLVELVPVSMAMPTRRYVVRVGDAAVEVGDDFDAATLRRILEVLRAC
jgi:hypothetical protein